MVLKEADIKGEFVWWPALSIQFAAGRKRGSECLGKVVHYLRGIDDKRR